MFSRRDKWRIAQATTLYLIASACLLAYPELAKKTVNTLSVHGNKSFSSSIWLVLNWVLLIGIQSSSAYCAIVMVGALTETKVASLREKVFEALMHTDNEQIQRLTPGDQLSRLINDSHVLGHFVSHTIPSLLPQLITCLGAFILLIRAEYVVAMMLLIVILPTTIVVRWLGTKSRRLGRKQMEANSELFSFADESIKTFLVSQAFCAERYVQAGFADKNRQLVNDSIKHLRVQHAYMPLTRSLGIFLFISFIILGWDAIDSAAWGAEHSATVLFYCFMVVRPASSASQFYGRLQYAKAALGRLKPIIDKYENDNKAKTKLDDVTEKRGSEARILQISNLTFKYPDQGFLIKNVSLKLRVGEIVLIRGPNGAGKSTLLHLLLRFLKPIGGDFCIDGKSVEKYTIERWRKHFGYVPQEPLLRSGTIRENIELGRTSSTDELDFLLQISGMNDVLADTRHTVDKQLSSGGNGLSGGQRQRCAVARALLDEPAFLLFDEPTSMQDTIGLRRFLDNRAQWSSNSGVLVISHDAELIGIADHVFEMCDGELISAQYQNNGHDINNRETEGGHS